LILRSRYLILLLLLNTHFLSAKTIIVSKQGAVTSIQQGVTMASAGDTVIIQKGNYKERGIVIDKKLFLKGEGYPEIDGENKGEIISVKSPHVSIAGLSLMNTGFSYVNDIAGIKLYRVKNCLVENNKLYNTGFGIYLEVSDSCIIRNNEIIGLAKNETEAGNAIHMFHCNHLTVEGNNVSGHRDGIYFEFVSDSKISNNTSRMHIRYGLHFMVSNNNEYFNNRFEKNGAGVAVMYSKNIYMHSNVFADNWSTISNGILLKEISDSRIENNLFERNTVGIYAEGTDRSQILHNDFKYNGWALKILGDCEDDYISDNNFISNTFEVVTNSSASHNKFEKNFWSNYNGYDLNKDGIGDIPHSPVTLFTYMIEKVPPAIMLLRSIFIDLLNLAEKITPVITPETLTDAKPLMKPIRRTEMKNPKETSAI